MMDEFERRDARICGLPQLAADAANLFRAASAVDADSEVVS